MCKLLNRHPSFFKIEISFTNMHQKKQSVKLCSDRYLMFVLKSSIKKILFIIQRRNMSVWNQKMVHFRRKSHLQKTLPSLKVDNLKLKFPKQLQIEGKHLRITNQETTFSKLQNRAKRKSSADEVKKEEEKGELIISFENFQVCEQAKKQFKNLHNIGFFTIAGEHLYCSKKNFLKMLHRFYSMENQCNKQIFELKEQCSKYQLLSNELNLLKQMTNEVNEKITSILGKSNKLTVYENLPEKKIIRPKAFLLAFAEEMGKKIDKIKQKFAKIKQNEFEKENQLKKNRHLILSLESQLSIKQQSYIELSEKYIFIQKKEKENETQLKYFRDYCSKEYLSYSENRDGLEVTKIFTRFAEEMNILDQEKQITSDNISLLNHLWAKKHNIEMSIKQKLKSQIFNLKQEKQASEREFSVIEKVQQYRKKKVSEIRIKLASLKRSFLEIFERKQQVSNQMNKIRVMMMPLFQEVEDMIDIYDLKKI